MKSTIFTFAFLFVLCLNVNAQTTKKISSEGSISVWQRTDFRSFDEEYNLIVKYDDTTIQFSTVENGLFTVLRTNKATKKYIIGEHYNFCVFYNIEKEQFFAIDFSMIKPAINGYGKDPSSLKKTSLNIMEMLIEGKSQNDVYAYLISQTDEVSDKLQN